MKQTLRVIAGFALLIPGLPLAVLLPEIGVPLLLFGTRLLGDRFKWAQALNARVDSTWAKVKAWLTRFRKQK
jgi:hypothetical protein